MIDDFYRKIETEYEIEGHSLIFFSDLGDLSESDRILVGYEFLALNNFEAETFKKRMVDDKDQIIMYFQQRITATKNIHLLAKYYHLLLYMSKNNSFTPKVIEHYQQVLSYYLAIHNQDFHTLHFSNVLGVLISICMRCKTNEDNIKNQINSYLTDPTLSSKIKTFILENIRDCKLFKGKELAVYPKQCIDLARVEDNGNIKERLLNLAIVFSRKTTNTELFKVANDLLGDFEYDNLYPDDETNMAISHLNENTYKKIVNYYKAAGQKKKQAKAIKDLEENKKNHQYIKIQSKVPRKDAEQTNKLITEHLESLLGNAPEDLAHTLCFDNGSLLFPPYSKIQECVKEEMKQTTYHQFFESKFVDINGNISSIPHETVGAHQFFYIWVQKNTFPFIITLLGRAIQEKKMSYSAVRRYLQKTAFGIQLETARGNKMLSYNWFSLVDIGIKEFFKQFTAFINGKNVDWRFTIDFLALKFEAILREIVQNTGGEVTKVRDNGDTELKLLDDLLVSPILKEIFNEDDIFLFKHTFTKVWWNIRNDVAHGLCKPFDYTLSKAILVLLCILRLNKVTIYIAHNQ